MVLSKIKKLTAENEELKNKINDIKKGQRILGRK
jgi:cell division protein FtsL